jgi:hypothetical protein
VLLEEQLESSKATRERADRVEARNSARDLLENLPGPTDIDPVAELFSEIRRAREITSSPGDHTTIGAAEQKLLKETRKLLAAFDALRE